MLYQNGGTSGGDAVLGCYSCIVNQASANATDNFYEYIEGVKTSKPNLASAYFTALGRERYSMYKTNNNPEKLKGKFGIPS